MLPPTVLGRCDIQSVRQCSVFSQKMQEDFSPFMYFNCINFDLIIDNQSINISMGLYMSQSLPPISPPPPEVLFLSSD